MSQAEPFIGSAVGEAEASCDDVVPVCRSRDMVAALRAHHAPVRYTEYAGLGHNVWVPAFADSTLPAWLFNQRRA